MHSSCRWNDDKREKTKFYFPHWGKSRKCVKPRFFLFFCFFEIRRRDCKRYLFNPSVGKRWKFMLRADTSMNIDLSCFPHCAILLKTKLWSNRDLYFVTHCWCNRNIKKLYIIPRALRYFNSDNAFRYLENLTILKFAK